LELRPKLVWRVISPIVAVGVLLVLYPVPWTAWLAVANFGLMALGAHRGYIRVEQGTIFRRGIIRWDKPFFLDELADVSLRRIWDRGGWYVELELKSRDGTTFSFQPRWWTNAARLLHAVAVSASAHIPDEPRGSLWKLDLAAETQNRLAEHL
jgi:ABC-type sugar transport system permease subunit